MRLVWAHQPRRALALVVLLTSALAWPVTGIENKCGACVAVQNELVQILIQERPQGSLDLRHRVNSQGKREGKVVDYRESEVRMIEILEGLCQRMSKYSLMAPKSGRGRIWMYGQHHSTHNYPRHTLEGSGEGWAFHAFGGAARLKAEEQGKELKRWCDSMLERHEDEVARMIREEVRTAYRDVPILLCRNITGHCADEDTYMRQVERMAPHLPVPSGQGVPGMPHIVPTETGDRKVFGAAGAAQSAADAVKEQGKDEL